MRHATITCEHAPHRTVVIGTVTVAGPCVSVEWRNEDTLPPLAVGYRRQSEAQLRHWLEEGLPSPDEALRPHEEDFWHGVRSCWRWKVRLTPFRRGPP